MKKALILEDKKFTLALIEGEITYIPISKLIKIIANSEELWDVKYVDIKRKDLIPLKNLSSLLAADIVRFEHLEKYATDIENFLIGGC